MRHEHFLVGSATALLAPDQQFHETLHASLLLQKWEWGNRLWGPRQTMFAAIAFPTKPGQL